MSEYNKLPTIQMNSTDLKEVITSLINDYIRIEKTETGLGYQQKQHFKMGQINIIASLIGEKWDWLETGQCYHDFLKYLISKYQLRGVSKGEFLKAEDNRGVLLITEEEYENMKNYFIENNYASSHSGEMGWDVRFAEFGNACKDIILKKQEFHLVILNDYVKEESTLITWYDEADREEFKFNSVDEFCLKINEYKKYLSEENGTVQAIDWIIFNKEHNE